MVDPQSMARIELLSAVDKGVGAGTAPFIWQRFAFQISALTRSIFRFPGGSITEQKSLKQLVFEAFLWFIDT